MSLNGDEDRCCQGSSALATTGEAKSIAGGGTECYRAPDEFAQDTLSFEPAWPNLWLLRNHLHPHRTDHITSVFDQAERVLKEHATIRAVKLWAIGTEMGTKIA